MDLEYKRSADGSLTIRFNGELDAFGCTKIRPELDRIAGEEQRNRVTLDLSEVSFLDSSGIGAIVFLYKRLKAAQGHLQIANVRGQPRELMQLLRIDSAIPITWEGNPGTAAENGQWITH